LLCSNVYCFPVLFGSHLELKWLQTEAGAALHDDQYASGRKKNL
jgi:hypothetical protein